MAVNHGNAISIYFMDPEQNQVEVYLDTPWHVSQPHGDPLDLAKPDAEIWAETERIVRADPTYLPAEQWSACFAQRLSA
jgi:catechol 2,3-dioxygenase